MPFAEEISAYLQAAGVGTENTNIFIGAHAVIPQGEGPFLTLVETGGTAPLNVQNRTAGYQRPSMQLLARGDSPVAVRAMVKAAYDALVAVRNTSLSGTPYLRIFAIQEPFDISAETGTGRQRFAFNIRALKQPS